MSAGALVIGVVLVLAWFATANLALSIASTIAAGLVSDRVTADARRARRLLVLRLLPAAGALIVSLLLFLPAHLWLEPPNPGERLGILPLTGAASFFTGRPLRALRRLVVMSPAPSPGSVPELPQRSIRARA